MERATGRRRGRGNCSQDVTYERRIKKVEERIPQFKQGDKRVGDRFTETKNTWKVFWKPTSL